MSKPLERLESEVLRLSPEERSRLAQLILVSLESESYEDSNTVEKAWGNEIERRVKELRSRTVRKVPGETVFKEIEDLTR
jgi:putative addiction module component (TIGR02574 family)